jgi:hypothetical protein
MVAGRTSADEVWEIATQVRPRRAGGGRPCSGPTPLARNRSNDVSEPPSHRSRHHRRRGAGGQHPRSSGLGQRRSGTHTKTLTVCVKSAYIDAPAPGKLFVGTIFKGNHFHVDRSVRVKTGSAKGLWHHGTRIATGSKGTYKTTGWVKASAFC